MVASTFNFSHLSPRSPRVASVCGNRPANQACHGPRSGMEWVLLPPHSQPCEHHTKHTRDAKRIITCGTKGPSYQTFETLSAAAACRTEVYVMPNHQERCQKEYRKICQKECQKICQKECQKIYQKICQKECQKICQKERQKIASSQSAKLRVTERISGDELYVYPHLTRSG